SQLWPEKHLGPQGRSIEDFSLAAKTMIPVRIAVEFESKTDDAVWDDAGNLIVPAGKRIAQDIREILLVNGIEVTPVSQRDFYGWEFSLTYRYHSILAVLQNAEKWLLVLGEMRLLPNLFLRRATRSSLEAVASIIKQRIETSGLGLNAKIIEFH